MQDATTLTLRANATVLLRAYSELTKPGITLFVGMSAAAGYVVTARGVVDPLTLLVVLVATMLSSGGAATLNQVAERHLDARMRRTANRPIPAGIIAPRTAALFGWGLSAAGIITAAALLTPLAVVFLLLCHVSYVFAYTPLKTRTELCTLVGAIPGALPVLAGSAAFNGYPDVAALGLTGLLFAWQIPHFMAIGWFAREQYARAGFRMLPVTDETGARTARVALLYAIATHGFAILVTREASISALSMAVVHTAGTAYYLAVIPFMLQRTDKRAKQLFLTSLLVLPVVLSALTLEFALR